MTILKKRMLLLAVVVALVAVWVSQGSSTTMADPGPNEMTIVAPAIVGAGEDFDIEVWVTDASTAFKTYQFGIPFPAGIDVGDIGSGPGVDVGLRTDDNPFGPGFTSCAPDATEAAYSVAVGGPISAGCTGATTSVDDVAFDIITLHCDDPGTYDLDFNSEETFMEDAEGNLIADLTLVGADVQCVLSTDIVVTKSDGTYDPVATQTPFVYTIKATNMSTDTNASGLVVADALPDGADTGILAGRGHKFLVPPAAPFTPGTYAVAAVDTTGDTNPDSAWLPCIPGFVGLYPLDVDGDTFPDYLANSAVACSAPLMNMLYRFEDPADFPTTGTPGECFDGLDNDGDGDIDLAGIDPDAGCQVVFFPGEPLEPGDSVVVRVTVQAPAAEAGKTNFDIALAILSDDEDLGVPEPTYDPDLSNENDCPEQLPLLNLGCEATTIMPAAVNIAKVGDPDPAKDGEDITWTVDIDVGSGSKASNPWGEGGEPSDARNCYDDLDNDDDDLYDWDGGPEGTGFEDPDCVEAGPVIRDDVDAATQSGIVSATMDIDGDTTADAGACLEEDGVPLVLHTDASGTNVLTDPDIICSLAAPIPANTANAKLVVTSTVDVSGVVDCENHAAITYGDPKTKTADGEVGCQPAGVTQHLDKGAVVIPTPINVLVGHTARVVVAETLEIVDPGPSPNLVHEWTATSAASDGIQIDWVEETGDTDAPVGFTDTVDLLTFLTTGHVPGLITLDRSLDVRCDAAGNQTNVEISLASIGATKQISPTTLKVQCFDVPEEVKVPDSDSLWLMRHPNCVDDDADSKVDEDPVDFDESGEPIDNDGDGEANEDFGPCNPWEGKGSILIEEVASAIADYDSPNDADNLPEGLGAYEKQIKFDHKLLDLKVENTDFLGSTGRSVNCTMEIVTENWIMVGCVSTGSQNGPMDPGPVTLTNIWVTPQADLFSRIRPTKDNGVVTTILDENCEWADKFGDPMAGMVNGGLVPVCGDATLTIRMLEGDVNLDCNVDVLDEQGIAFRYGASFGLLLYDKWFDLEPKLTDFDIDIKDLQFVFGRDGSTCNVPIPLQP